MIMNRVELASAIGSIATEVGSLGGFRLSVAALNALTKIPATFESEDYDIDLEKLREAVANVVVTASLFKRGSVSAGPLRAADINSAIAKSDCHYLWFC